MKHIVLAASALALVSGVALSVPAQAASYNHHGKLSAYERAVIAHKRAHLRQVERKAHADGHVSLWERAKIRVAKSRLHAQAYRYRHN
jgi:hypothetical protein